MKKLALKYGLLLSVFLIIFTMIQMAYFSHRISLNVFLGVVAIIFMGIGIYAGVYVSKRKATPQNAAINNGQNVIIHDHNAMLSSREQEVLLYLIKGYSNKEIAADLFVSVNTVKTHIANIYSKLGVKRRTQAVSKAKELGLVSEEVLIHETA